MSNFLCIQNPGVAPVEGFTLLGVSTTRDCGVEGTVGQFGSGNKHAINVLLRAGLKVIAYCGKTRLDFQTRDDEIDDGLVRKLIKRVVCKMGGTSTRTIDLGWVLDFGAIDWTDLGMALREFISNAIDRTIREENGEFLPAVEDCRLSVSTVDEIQVRAKDGYTRVYIEVNEAVTRYCTDLPNRFLHFSADPSQVKKSFLPKTDRNLSGKKTAVIYRAGVFVREIEESDEQSVYDYNFKPNELAIDECRNSSDYTIKAAIARLFRKASIPELVPVFEALVEQRETFENRLDGDYIMPYWDTPKEEQKKNWQQAWQAVAADAVMCSPSATIVGFVQRKGHAVKPVSADGFRKAAERFGIPTERTVLNSTEQKGREKIPATQAALSAVDTIWSLLVKLNLTNGKEKPPVGCFRDVMSGGERLLGFCDSEGVYLSQDHASGMTKSVLKTALEECTHWVTGSTDMSRDFQDYLLNVIIELNDRVLNSQV
jgi:hypothetical protein